MNASRWTTFVAGLRVEESSAVQVLLAADFMRSRGKRKMTQLRGRTSAICAAHQDINEKQENKTMSGTLMQKPALFGYFAADYC